MKMRSLKRTC